MSLKIAIQPDEIIHGNGERQSYSDRWFELARDMDIEAISVDAFSGDILETVSACDAFMWRYDPPAFPRLFADRLVKAIEEGLEIPVFPSLQSRWHFEDKIGQHYFLAAAGIPTPATHISWTRDQAEQFCRTATYPFVLKLANGYKASNVRLIENADAALFYVDQMFGTGVRNLGYQPAHRSRLLLRKLRAATEMIKGQNPYGPTPEADLQYGYFLVQEFLPDNEFDVRVTVTGNRAFVFRRFNRPGDFRASGSGNLDWNPDQVSEEAVRLGYQVAQKLDSQTLTVDILRRDGELVIVELGLAYASWAVRDCPGHWVLTGEPSNGELEWVEGPMHPGDAIFIDFVDRLERARDAAF